MEGTARIWFTSQQRAELWERWKNGQCVADIARALARRNKSGVYRILALNGGIAPEPRGRGRSARLGAGVAPEALSPGVPREATMARRAEARAAVVAGADLRLAEAATACRPRHADIARNDLSKSFYSDPRRAEETADGASAVKPRAAPHRADWDRSSILSPS